MSALLAAARLGDPVAHTASKGWMMAGLIAGALIGAAAVVVTGGAALTLVAAAAAGAAAGGGLGEVLGTMSWAPRHVTGSLISGSFNVFVNGRPAVRAHLSQGICSDHPGSPQLVAQGSSTVFINGQPAARMEDMLTCSAVISAGSPDVFIGGATLTTDDISPEIPAWVNWTMAAVGVAAAAVLAGPVVAALGAFGGFVGGEGGAWIGGKIFGVGSDGQKWSMLGGSLLGGYAGAKGAGLAARGVPKAPAINPGELTAAPDYLNAVSKFTGKSSAEIEGFYKQMNEQGATYQELVGKAVDKYGLTPDEGHAVFGYTTKLFYRDLNQTLLAGGSPESEGLSSLIQSGLDKMPSSSPVQYRGWRLEDPEALAKFDSDFAPGKTVESNFWSTAPSEADAYVADRNVVIRTDQAKDISDLAFGVHYHGLIGKPVYSSETLIPPGVPFKVIGTDSAGRIILEQL
ncbi:PAAR domain-containing protein [Ralstonia solanacearum]|uniref:PAAR domain-containing protein n=1 Tax=Ralstonia solanacearum TaxID=305 RepID=UPI000A478A47|nr:PAAR domain-containing protein [Ralstonia solanacearum]